MTNGQNRRHDSQMKVKVVRYGELETRYSLSEYVIGHTNVMAMEIPNKLMILKSYARNWERNCFTQEITTAAVITHTRGWWQQYRHRGKCYHLYFFQLFCCKASSRWRKLMSIVVCYKIVRDMWYTSGVKVGEWGKIHNTVLLLFYFTQIIGRLKLLLTVILI